MPYANPCKVESAAAANDVVAFLVFQSELRAKRLAPRRGAGGAGTAGTTAGVVFAGEGGTAGAEVRTVVGTGVGGTGAGALVDADDVPGSTVTGAVGPGAEDPGVSDPDAEEELPSGPL